MGGERRARGDEPQSASLRGVNGDARPILRAQRRVNNPVAIGGQAVRSAIRDRYQDPLSGLTVHEDAPMGHATLRRQVKSLQHMMTLHRRRQIFILA